MDLILQSAAQDWNLIIFPLAVIIGLVLAFYVFVYSKKRKKISDLVKKDENIVDEKTLEKVKKLKENESYPYTPKKVLNEKEMEVYYTLVEELPYFNVLSKVNYTTFLKVKEGFDEKLMRSKIKTIYADILVVKRDFTPILVIEFTDDTRETKFQKVIEKKKKVLSHSKVPHLFFDINNLPSEKELISQVKDKLKIK